MKKTIPFEEGDQHRPLPHIKKKMEEEKVIKSDKYMSIERFIKLPVAKSRTSRFRLQKIKEQNVKLYERVMSGQLSIYTAYNILKYTS